MARRKPRPDELGTLGKCARELGVTPNALYSLRARRADFPDEHMELGDTTYYVIAEVVDWYDDRVRSLPTYNTAGGRPKAG